jgi:hypothetical protein
MSARCYSETQDNITQVGSGQPVGRHSAKNASLIGAKSKISARTLSGYNQHDAMPNCMMMMQKTLELGVGFGLSHPMEINSGLGIGRSTRKLSKRFLLQGNEGFYLADGQLRRGRLHRTRRGRGCWVRAWRNEIYFAKQRPDMAGDRTP